MKAHWIVPILLAVSLPSFAQTYPNKSLRMIIPFPAGGGSDAIGRIIGLKLGEQMSQAVVVDNRAGAGGSIGTEMAVRSPADGYTLVLASTSEIAINPALYTKLSYDTADDLVPVALVASTPMVIVVAPSVAVASVKDLIVLAKAKPGQVNVASAGSGTTTHLAGELFRSIANVTWTHVPYKGAPPALADVAGGRVELMFSSLPGAMPLIKAKRVKAIAVSTKKRAAALPDVPTVMEAGLPSYEVEYWWGIFVPARTPVPIITHLYQETAQALKQTDVIGSLANQGAVAGELTQPQFAQFVRSELPKWGNVVKSSGAKAD